MPKVKIYFKGKNVKDQKVKTGNFNSNKVQRCYFKGKNIKNVMSKISM